MKLTAGSILREKREQKKLSVQTAAADINMTVRHINALEDDNFSMFPGETYTLGFLRSYAQYLEVDAEKVLQLYRGALLGEREVPLEELTRPTITNFDKAGQYIKGGLIILVIATLGIFSYNYFNDNNSTRIIATNTDDIDNFVPSDSKLIPDIKTENINIRSGNNTILVSKGEGVDFSIDNSEVYLVLVKLNYQKGINGLSEATLLRYPGRVKLHLIEGKPVIISDKSIPRKFKITLDGATPNNIKAQIELLGRVNKDTTNIDENTKPTKNSEKQVFNPDNFKIVFYAKTTKDNYVEIYVDGKPEKKGLIGKGSILSFVAEQSIQFKIGDAGAIDISINQKKYTFGKPGQQIKKIIRKVKDPLKQTEYNIIIKDI